MKTRSFIATLLFVSFTALGAWPTGAEAAATDAASDKMLPWLPGAWSRDWIEKGGVRSSPLDVHYLQTPTYFADVRVPKDGSRVIAAKSFADLSEQQLKFLEGQSGFTGLTAMKGNIATWHHEIEFQPPDGTADEGRLQRILPDRMHEQGLDGSYTESWKSLDAGHGRFLVIRVEHAGRLLRSLVMVGDRFVYVRNRAKDLPSAPSFDALIEATHATREQIVEYLDCEFSFGRIRGGSAPWRIERSTLPWRVGQRLEFVDEVLAQAEGTRLGPRETGPDAWTVPVNTFSSREISVLFRPR